MGAGGFLVGGLPMVGFFVVGYLIGGFYIGGFPMGGFPLLDRETTTSLALGPFDQQHHQHFDCSISNNIFVRIINPPLSKFGHMSKSGVHPVYL